MAYGEANTAYDSPPTGISKQSPGAATMDALQRELNGLHQSLDVLEKRLVPVLTASGPEPTDAERKEGAGSAHVTQLIEFLQIARTARAKVERLVRRIEL